MEWIESGYLRALLKVKAAVERTAKRMVVMHRHPLDRVVLHKPQIRLRSTVIPSAGAIYRL